MHLPSLSMGSRRHQQVAPIRQIILTAARIGLRWKISYSGRQIDTASVQVVSK